MAIFVDDDFPKELRTWSGSKNYKFEFTAQRQWQVRTTSLTDGPELVLSYLQAAPYNLYIGQIWPDNGYLYCTDLDWEAGEPDAYGARIWTITYHYGSFPIELTEPNPLLRPYVIDWDTEVAEEPVERDYSGTTWATCKPIATTAGTPFDPPVMRPITYSILRITRNEAINTYDEEFIQNYRWTVNVEDPWQVWIPTSGTTTPRYITIPARCALCTSIKPTRVFSQTLQVINDDATMGYYLEVEYTFSLKFLSWGQEDPDNTKWNLDDVGQGWDKRILNKGFNYLDGSGNVQRAKDAQGNFTADAVFLDKDGHVSKNPTWRTFQVYGNQTFVDFGFVLPTP